MEDDIAMVTPRYGTWAEGYADFERHTNVTPGVTRNQTSYGMAAGFDRTFLHSGWAQSGFQIGVFGGYNDTRSTFSPRTTAETRNIALDDGTSPATAVTVNTFDTESESNGGFVGAYTTYFQGPLSGDLSIKADFFDFTQRATEFITAPAPCGGTPVLLGPNFLDNSTSETNIIFAGNANWRMPLHSGFWFEPTAGFRLTLTRYGDNAAAIGLDDGSAFRLQAGARVGRSWLESNRLWTFSVAGLLYSDVEVDGYLLTTAALPSGTAEVDEGKLRALGQLNLKIDFLDGTSLYSRVEVRGGEDVIGVGGKLGARVEW